jgi:FkbM family methyltransferase
MITVIGHTEPPPDRTMKVGRSDIPNVTLNLNLSDRHERAYYGSFSGERKVLDHIIAKNLILKDDIVADVGANIGFCALVYLLDGAAKVYSFEPNPTVFERLQSLECEQIVVSDLALTDTIGESELILSSSHNQGHTLSRTQADYSGKDVFGDTPETCVVKTSTLDDVMGDTHIDFLKIDIEGVEIEFLKGAENILTNDPPRMVHIEIYPLALDETVKLLRKYYTHVKRVVVTKDQELRLIDVGVKVTGNDVDYNHPPTYLCYEEIFGVTDKSLDKFLFS